MDLPLVAVGVGLVGGYLASIVSGAGTTTWNLIERKGRARLAERRERQAAKVESIHREAAAVSEAAKRAECERDRVGARFLRRHTAEDSGTIVTIVDLGRDWTRQVLVEEFSPEGRQPTEFDSEIWTRTNVEWAALTRPAPEQIHRTARMSDSFDDADGWVEFERIS